LERLNCERQATGNKLEIASFLRNERNVSLLFPRKWQQASFPNINKKNSSKDLKENLKSAQSMTNSSQEQTKLDRTFPSSERALDVLREARKFCYCGGSE
jgi:hypothetical protein